MHTVYSTQAKSETEAEETPTKSEFKRAWRRSLKQSSKVPCGDISLCPNLASCMAFTAPGPHAERFEANPTHPT